MKFTVTQEKLAKALSQASRIVTTKAHMPILNNIKIEATDDGVQLLSTDLELGMRIKISAKVEETGMLTVPARVITELVSNCAVGNITMSEIKEELHIQSASLSAKVSGMSAEEFPEIPRLGDNSYGSLSAEQMMRAIQRVGFAAAIDDSRPVLTAIQIREVDGTLELAATDGFRLSWLKIDHKDSSFLDKQTLLIPAKALLEVVKLIDPSVKDVRIGANEKKTQIIFELGDIQLVSRLVSGEFPQFQKIVPEAGDTEVIFNRNDLLRVMKIASIFARESANIVKFSIKEGRVAISANAPQVGNQNSQVEADVSGPDVDIAFNYRYVLDFLNNVFEDQIKLSVTNALGPGLWTEQGKKKESFIKDFKHVIMPVRMESSV